MPLFQLSILALVQGITEFLPISSSGHLILLPWALGTPDQGLMIDVAVHVGTLGAVMLFFRRDVARILCGTIHLLTGRRTPDAAFAGLAVALGKVAEGGHVYSPIRKSLFC